MKNITKLILLLFAIFILGTGCRSQAQTGARDIFAGVADVFILREDNTLWGAGYNRSDQFGLGSASGDPRITRINDEKGSPFGGIKSVAAGENHTVILKDDGTLWGAGDSSYGELGLEGGRLSAFTQLKADGAPISGVKAVAAGNNSTFFIDSEGSLWATGYNYYGELGLGTRVQQSSFKKAESAGKDIKAIAAGIRHTVLLKEDGTLWAAGYNYNGQLGLGADAQGDTADKDSFTEVKDAGSGITGVAAGNYHTVILKKDGSVWTAGSNYWGQLGFSDRSDHLSFTRVSDEKGNPLTGVKDIAARGNITVLLKADGSLLLAGNYTDSEGMVEPASNAGVGEDSTQTDGSSFIPLVPEQGAKFPGVKKIVLGYNSIYVIATDGCLWAAGSNRYGQLSLDSDTETSSVLKLIE